MSLLATSTSRRTRPCASRSSPPIARLAPNRGRARRSGTASCTRSSWALPRRRARGARAELQRTASNPGACPRSSASSRSCCTPRPSCAPRPTRSRRVASGSRGSGAREYPATCRSCSSASRTPRTGARRRRGPRSPPVAAAQRRDRSRPLLGRTLGIRGYRQRACARMLRDLGAHDALGGRGGIHLVRADHVTPEERQLLEATAHAVLDRGRTLARATARRRSPRTAISAAIRSDGADRADRALTDAGASDGPALRQRHRRLHRRRPRVRHLACLGGANARAVVQRAGKPESSARSSPKRAAATPGHRTAPSIA